MGQGFPSSAIAVYIHIPFCLSKCGYCSFFSLPYSRAALSDYLRYLHQEITLFEADAKGKITAATLYFGGGTPSLMSAEDINGICSRFKLLPDAEVTLELNPLQITPAFLKELNSTPVNRLSIGVQSLLQDELSYLDRRHKPSDIAPKIQLCRDHGYHNLSLDIIYGLPGSTVDALQRNLDMYLALNTPHISAYLLTLDESCALASHSSSLPPEDALAEQYHTLRNTLEQAGLQRYEISNFAIPGKQSRHNLAYWHCTPYLALGASAAGWMPPYRYTNPASLDDYYRMLNEHRIMPERETMCPDDAAQDYVMMSLRMKEGISFARYKQLCGKDFPSTHSKAIDHLLSLGLIAVNATHLRLSDTALFVSNAVIAELM